MAAKAKTGLLGMGLKVKCVRRDTPGWDRIWSVIQERYGDTVAECSETGETWQYMGSYSEEGRPWFHEFRHRSLKGRREYTRVAAVEGDFEPDAVEEEV
jgi:hypothetical protein